MSRPDRLAGLRLALTTLTVAPLPARRGRAAAGPVDRRAAGTAMAWAPAVGLLLGALLGGLAVALRAAGAPGLLLGALVVAAGALLTRGLHLDGLADTADGLGSYAGPERALRVMREPGIGAFGAVALVLAVLVPVGAITGLAGGSGTGLLLGVAVPTAAGRLAVTWACRRGVPAARPEGLGALVAGTVGWPALVPGTVGLLAVAAVAVPGRPWQGPAAVVVAVLASQLLVRHAVRRLGGITGDVLGACVEVTGSVTYAALALA